jgi:hypothetical protein
MSTTAARIGRRTLYVAPSMYRLVATAALTIALLLAPAAVGAKNGITPISPKNGDAVPAGKRPTFKLRYSGGGPIFVHVCESGRKNKLGLICDDAWIGKAKKQSRRRASYKAPYFDIPRFWLNNPGTYYWQAHRIKCEDGDLADCRQEGPVVKFKVS